MKIVFVASECAPFAKSGGLGDVVAGLSKSLARRGHDVRIILPLYRSIDREKFGLEWLANSCVHMGAGEENWIGVHSAQLENEVTVWLMEYEHFFGRPALYGDTREYADNAYRFALLSKAALQICKDQDFIPDVMHVHDWMTSLCAAYLKTWDRMLSPLSHTASVLTIHNIGYQGVYEASALSYIGLGGEHFHADALEDNGKINLLKAGIHFADAITTVSPTHAHELLEPQGGQGLAPYLNNRRGDLRGILNGVDYEHWNPATDTLIPATFSSRDMSGKTICKAALQERMGLDVSIKVPLFGIVSRFASQKGFDLLRACLNRVLDSMPIQIAVLGTGDLQIENYFRGLESRYTGRVGVHVGFSNELSHWIEAGSDFFLMPSLYEPCGLNQSYSMRYGTLPIVRATGGLDDTVHNYDEITGAGTGFKFHDVDADALYYCIGWAVSTWFDRPHHIAQLREQAMSQEFSWNDAARLYEVIYERAQSNRLSHAV